MTVRAYSAVDMFLAVCRSYDVVREIPPNTNRGWPVECVLSSVGLDPGNPWCAADMYKIGTSALEDDWPLPKTGSCQALADFATKHNILMETPERGDIFVLWEHVKQENRYRFAHTGAIETPAGLEASTWEGNTSGAGSREGWGHFHRHRTFGVNDRFIRWSNLL
jgi:hypothetical protein